MTDDTQSSKPRRLTAESRELINRLIARGVPAAEAMRDPTLIWEDVPALPHGCAEDVLRRTPTRFATIPEVDRALAELFERLEHEGLVPASDRAAVAAKDLDALERKLGLRLPHAYRRFMEIGGGRRNRLFSHDHIGVEFPVVKRYGQTSAWKLGAKAGLRGRAPDLVAIEGRLGESYLFLRAGAGDALLDACVFVVDENQPEPRLAYASIVDWLEDLAKLGLDALRSGYFEDHPNGTTP